MSTKETWPFRDAPNTASIATSCVVDGTHPIRLITHGAEDGMWQFLCGATNETEDARIVGLRSILELDPSVAELADLPLGWRAWRSAPGELWHRQRSSTG